MKNERERLVFKSERQYMAEGYRGGRGSLNNARKLRQ